MDCKSDNLADEFHLTSTTLEQLHQSHFVPIHAIDSLTSSNNSNFQDRVPPPLPFTAVLPPPPAFAPGEGLGDLPTSGYSVVRDGKVFGVVEGSLIGQTFKTRWQLGESGIHRPIQAGICGTALLGAESVVLSGGYEDDADNGEEVTYTGCGGFAKRVQVMDQSTENPRNAALCTSISSKVPVRVVRGFSLKSVYAPVEGYRYDGLYLVTSMWKERRDKMVVLRFHLERLEGQPPIPVREKRSKKRSWSISENISQTETVSVPPHTENEVQIKKEPSYLLSSPLPVHFAVPYPIMSPSFVNPVSTDVFRKPIWL